MNLSTTRLVLAPDGAVDLQFHTTYSDGIWTPAQLFDHLVSEQFAFLDTPSAQQPHALVALVKNYGTDTGATSAEQIVLGAGSTFATNDITAVVDAAHRSGAVCLIAHPGRDEALCALMSLCWINCAMKSLLMAWSHLYYSSQSKNNIKSGY